MGDGRELVEWAKVVGNCSGMVNEAETAASDNNT